MALNFYAIFVILLPILLVPRSLKSDNACQKELSIFSLIILIFNAALAYLAYVLNQNNLWLIHIYTMLELSFFTWVFRTVLGRNLTLLILIIFNGLALMGIFIFGDLEKFNPWTSALEALLIILYVLSYFYQTARDIKVEDITRMPLFWLSTGALIYFSSSLFLFIFSNYIFPEVKLSLIFWGIHAMLSILLYIFFFITLWVKPPIKSSSSFS